MSPNPSNKIPNFTAQQLQRLNDQELAALNGLLKAERYARIDAKCALLETDENGWAKMTSGPLYWAQNFTRTENPHYVEQNVPFVAPFPKKSYFQPLLGAMMHTPRLFIPKSREMMASWATMVFAAHKAQWHKAEVIVQTENEEKAKRLVYYAECLYRNQDPELKALHPLAGPASQLSIQWADGGKIFGIPQGENKIRMFHPTLYIMDEAAFLPEAEQCFAASHPVTRQIIAISSAAPGWFADECSDPGGYEPEPMQPPQQYVTDHREVWQL